MNTQYTVALWQSRLAPWAMATLDIEAETPRLAAVQAMQLRKQDAMGVIVVMNDEKQTTYFDVRLEGDALQFSKTEEFSRLSDNPLIDQSYKWRN